MKKILIATLGLGLAIGSVSFTFAQGDTTTKKKGKKSGNKKVKKDTSSQK